MALIWPLPVTVPFLCWSVMICLTFPLLLCWSSCGISIQNPGVFFSLISHYLRNLRFVPSSLRTKANADGSLSSGQRQQQGCREKEWRLSERVVTSRYPVHFFASFYFLSLLLVHISCHVRCNAGYIRWWALVELRWFLFCKHFFYRFLCLRAMALSLIT